MNTLNENGKGKQPEWDQALEDRRAKDSPMKWDERDGSKRAAWGGILFFVALMFVFVILEVCPKYPN